MELVVNQGHRSRDRIFGLVPPPVEKVPLVAASVPPVLLEVREPKPEKG